MRGNTFPLTSLIQKRKQLKNKILKSLKIQRVNVFSAICAEQEVLNTVLLQVLYVGEKLYRNRKQEMQFSRFLTKIIDLWVLKKSAHQQKINLKALPQALQGDTDLKLSVEKAKKHSFLKVQLICFHICK